MFYPRRGILSNNDWGLLWVELCPLERCIHAPGTLWMWPFWGTQIFADAITLRWGHSEGGWPDPNSSVHIEEGHLHMETQRDTDRKTPCGDGRWRQRRECCCHRPRKSRMPWSHRSQKGDRLGSLSSSWADTSLVSTWISDFWSLGDNQFLLF